jgi:hypothetical protein
MNPDTDSGAESAFRERGISRLTMQTAELAGTFSREASDLGAEVDDNDRCENSNN